jgi:hypothetical protein
MKLNSSLSSELPNQIKDLAQNPNGLHFEKRPPKGDHFSKLPLVDMFRNKEIELDCTLEVLTWFIQPPQSYL